MDVSIEAQNACRAFDGIDSVMELTETRRFKDDVLPRFMNFMRTADGSQRMPEELWRTVRNRSVEVAGAELEHEKFATGHVVGIFWENIARSMMERAMRDANRLDVPLIFSQACDKRPVSQRWGKRSETERRVVHELLTTVNVHKTGHLHGLLPMHEGMRMRLLCKVSAVDGLVNER